MELSNPQHETFAQHVAAGCSLTEAAKRSGYKPSACNNMGSRVAMLGVVRNRIDELKALQGRTAMSASGVRNPQSRVTALEDRWHRMRQIIIERSQDPELASVPGGKTGLLVMTFKQLGSGKDASVVREYRVDTELLRELRAHEQQAAEELGQWTTRKETYNSSINVSLSDPAALSDAIKQQLASLPADDRMKLIELAPPELAEAIALEAEKEPEK